MQQPAGIIRLFAFLLGGVFVGGKADDKSNKRKTRLKRGIIIASQSIC
jgi:hypothetical protein